MVMQAQINGKSYEVYMGCDRMKIFGTYGRVAVPEARLKAIRDFK